ncbi:hypothetical protein [Erythrobacter rubeus]|uniref:Uncharacterized protein n=1 Tax=Erythrobacter rubeus TaxID=2760803 RepID=A0ABR8KXW5_9SPHN|nr:hypothetical protein [Erythrobacter rubeus]MBD2843072.1 hypothetical protein [Erythrobacter rubeus]
MSKILQSLIWAGAIIAAALFCVSNGVSDSASFGIVMGLSGAAWGSLQGEMGCGRRCLS